MKNNLTILAVLALLSLCINVNAQTVNTNEDEETITEVVIAKEITNSSIKNTEEVKKATKKKSACKPGKFKPNNKKCTKAEKAKCAKQIKGKSSNVPAVKKCTANLSSCNKKKPTN